MKSKRRVTAVIACFLAIATIFTACKTTGNTSQTSGGQIGNKVLNYPLTSAPTTMNAHVTEQVDTNVIDLVQGNLYRWVPSSDGSKATLAPDLAAGEPTVSADGLTWTIKIDPNAKWSNGDPINADTFIYSWKMALDPALLNAPAGATCGVNYIT
ncbi:MAG: ABC transporter substrate-binding protein, partial [Bacillota bacterium]|nr:ABC transporter substrate-binding protein [Bacillota bacterium]